MNEIVGVAGDRAGMRCQNLEDALVLPFRLDAYHPSLSLNLNGLTRFDHLIENAVDVLAKVRGGKKLSHAPQRTPHVVRTSTRGLFIRLTHTYAIPYDRLTMKTITASEARTNLYKLIDETAVTSEPVQITGKRADAVLVSMDDWRAIQETLYLLSIPGMRASIRKGLATPVKECLESLDW
jgi:antitoxin YefM